MEYKQVIVMRTDINLSTGKAAAQAAHASIGAYKKAGKIIIQRWEKEGGKKAVLSVNSEDELIQIYEKAKRKKLPAVLIRDAGLTEIPQNTATAVGIGPEKNEIIDKLTGALPLLS